MSQDATNPSSIGNGSVLDDWIVPRAPASTSVAVSFGMSWASAYSGVPRRPSRAKPVFGPAMRTQAPLKAAGLALTSAMAASTAARFFSTSSGLALRPGMEKGSDLRMTTGPRSTPFVPAVKLGVPNQSAFSAGLVILPNQGPRLKPTGTSPASSSSASSPHCLNCQTAQAVASL